VVSQGILIGIIVGVFFAGLGLGYAVLQSNVPVTPMMTQQQMQQMMNDPNTMNQWHQTMMKNPQMMNQWMSTMINDPQFMQQMHNSMMNNPQHMQTMSTMMGPDMMGYMMNNPQMNQQMMNTMMGNQQFMYGMMMDPQFQQNWMGPWMSNSTNWNHMMGSGWMNQGMMGNHMMGQQIQKQDEDKSKTTLSSYVQMVDGVQVVTIYAKEFKFIPSEISINAGKTKFILVNDGVSEHELVVYEASKKDIVDKAELAEDEATIEKNILFEIEEVHPRESGETDVLILQEGTYVMGCHVPGHYAAGMKGTIEIKP